jgi:threonine synthase
VPLSPGALPFACPNARAGDDIDHVLSRVWAASPEAAAPRVDAAPRSSARAPEQNPFVRYRERLSSHAYARANGMSDEEFVLLVRRLDEAVCRVDGVGFVETPFREEPTLAACLGFEPPGVLLVKDETGNVSGSHKGRHLMGVMLYLQVGVHAGQLADRSRLAISSCGNAALAAAVVAAAAGWPLDVFVPPSASPSVLARLGDLGAAVHTCPREAGVAGDPCYAAFRRAVAGGAIPFCCQGSDNGLTIEGGATIAWEMGLSPDAVFVQVGGGALASAVAQGFGALPPDRIASRQPSLYTVQTAGGYPLARAYDRIVARMLSEWRERDAPPGDSPAALARAIAGCGDATDRAMAYARAHRSGFMWPWEEEPASVAHGILDDETYDWAGVVEGMLRSGGRPLVVGEERLREANRLAREATGIDVDHTGSAGLAGLMTAIEQDRDLLRSRVAIIFTGRRR